MTPLDRKLLTRIQQGFPLEKRPYAKIAEESGISEQFCMERIKALMADGCLRYIKPIFNASSLGYKSVLVGMKVSRSRADDVAKVISDRREVSHNYLRQGELNLWFTFTYESEPEKNTFLSTVRSLDGVEELCEFPSEKTYKIGLKLAV
jgi:siroheme decarboxylase